MGCPRGRERGAQHARGGLSGRLRSSLGAFGAKHAGPGPGPQRAAGRARCLFSGAALGLWKDCDDSTVTNRLSNKVLLPKKQGESLGQRAVSKCHHCRAGLGVTQCGPLRDAQAGSHTQGLGRKQPREYELTIKKSPKTKKNPP